MIATDVAPYMRDIERIRDIAAEYGWKMSVIEAYFVWMDISQSSGFDGWRPLDSYDRWVWELLHPYRMVMFELQ